MSKLWTILTHLHTLAGPGVMLLYPLYASVQAMESPSKLDDEQWLAYWILYSFVTLVEMVLESLIYWIPIWYELKLLFLAWLALPNFRGAAFIYDSGIGSKKENGCKVDKSSSPSTSPKEKESAKSRFLSFVTPKKDH
ncbi:unnamed protein product [Triticum turgidum subsp. durum]|uniref:HVA22-like protein n=1 Tax=Triticum turgidum subsp. durum TaxID=4567 RepID=A0A9R0X0B3_TRITD|nr:unnamed protein product [Triticum turgidum subsp. durum]